MKFSGGRRFLMRSFVPWRFGGDIISIQKSLAWGGCSAVANGMTTGRLRQWGLGQ